MIIGYDYVGAIAQGRTADHRRPEDQRHFSTGKESRWRPRLMAALRAIAFASAAQYSLPFVPELRDYPVGRP
ncbi:hypothetical protein EV644_101177 [Kribbella orskensis]|uniref:Uncharacterized protein n=1 Tax=Kribbella orskensis TaxID=2512216 RepID=A0ABY2BTE3_9ACTN|nr:MULTISPECIES: hypothetical protein [Kribbella]TCN44685.1 hypothetical protein EV642_101812 [Kribbella sp. VKM Ac-2500]TCO31537.1 hypothetical protein EV644_101177 [Kribbella orskensis]